MRLGFPALVLLVLLSWHFLDGSHNEHIYFIENVAIRTLFAKYQSPGEKTLALRLEFLILSFHRDQ